MVTDFLNSFTVGLGSKFATRSLSYFPPHLQCVATGHVQWATIELASVLVMANLGHGGPYGMVWYDLLACCIFTLVLLW